MQPPYSTELEDIQLDMGEEILGEQEDMLVYDEDDVNLVATFEAHEEGQDALRKIASYVVEKTDEAKDSSEQYRNRLADDNRLLTGELKPKEWPFENCANLNVPILLENTLRLHARLFSEIFGDFTNVMGIIPVGPDDEPVAEMMSFHDNWQLREDIPDFQRQADRMLLMYLFAGDVTCHTYFDPMRKQNRHEMLTPDNFYVPYALTSTMPDYSDVPYCVKVLTFSRAELQRMRDQFEHVDEVLDRESAWTDDPEQPMSEEANQVSGIVEPDGDSYTAPYRLYQFEGWCSLLPNQEVDRFIQCIVDPYTLHVMKLSIHEEVPWKDQAKERARQEELNSYRSKIEEVGRARAQQEEKFLQARDEALTNGVTVEEAEQVANLGTMAIPDPEPPAWISDPENPPLTAPSFAKRPIRMFAHGVNIEPLAGALGIGYGRIQADFTRAANVMINQHIDAATMSNAPPILTSARLPDDLTYEPGKFIPVDIPAEELAKALFPVPAPQPNPQLMAGVEFAYRMAQSSVQAPDVLSGAPGKSGETFRGIASRIEQATKQLSTTGRKFANFFKQICLNNARLNSMYLEETQMLLLMNHKTKQYQNVRIDRSMYERDYRVELRADLKFSTEAQKQQEAMEMLEMSAQLPHLQTNMRLQYEATKDFLESKGREDLVAYLGAPPPPPQMFGEPPQVAAGAPGVAPPPEAPGPGGEAPGTPMGGA